MAMKDKPDNEPKQLKQDPLVEHLVPDPVDHQPTIQLTGWLGKAAKEGFWRLYLTPQLDEYVQFADKDVIYTQPAKPEHSPLGGTTVWLQAATTLQPHAGCYPPGAGRFSCRRDYRWLYDGNGFLPAYGCSRATRCGGWHSRLPVLGESSHSRLPAPNRRLLSHQGRVQPKRAVR
jgi:hypothetical protein